MFGYDVLKVRSGRSDFFLTSLVVLMTGLGLSFLFSASYFVGERLFDNSYHFFIRQVFWAIIGGIGAFFASRVPYDIMKKYVPIFLIVTFILMLLTLVPFLSRPLMGARRWIILGPLTFQPSELLKLTMILYIANFYSKRPHSMDSAQETFIPPMLVVLGLSALCLLQNDFSAAVFSFVLGVGMMFAAGLKLKFLLPTLVLGIPTGLFFLFSRDYRVDRLMTFFNPSMDPSGAGYQILAARRALSSGGFWGLGVGSGVRKLGAIPEVQADFIGAVMGEETGFFGLLLLFGLFGFFAFKAFQISWAEKDLFRLLLATGIGISITLQFLINLGVVSGALPATGVTLPFFSSGGSSLFVHLVMAGILIGLSRKQDDA